MTEFEKMIAGQVFDGEDPSIVTIRQRATALKLRINQCIDDNERNALQQQLFGSFGTDSVVQPPFHCEFGQTIRIGHHTFLNMNVVMLDNVPITIGDNVLIGPSCQFYTASHSLDYRSRRLWETESKPIVVEDDVWIGGHVVINQGVTIGARSVVAANSVVNQDVPPDTLVGGTPARIIRHLAREEDASFC
ncbi:sugar O-acetyltransferase [Vibrio furnissii]|uniref:sugar O-acetyltransferase n=1 Tax=Vibrio furnissii TaxID=29494 RepID=UPI0012AD5249|nr:sugar O-acetyltransferase [Vibrio furnissii]